jgi:hypothetical protein
LRTVLRSKVRTKHISLRLSMQLLNILRFPRHQFNTVVPVFAVDAGINTFVRSFARCIELETFVLIDAGINT